MRILFPFPFFLNLRPVTSFFIPRVTETQYLFIQQKLPKKYLHHQSATKFHTNLHIYLHKAYNCSVHFFFFRKKRLVFWTLLDICAAFSPLIRIPNEMTDRWPKKSPIITIKKPVYEKITAWKNGRMSSTFWRKEFLNNVRAERKKRAATVAAWCGECYRFSM